MTITSTPRAGLNRLLNLCAALAVLLLAAGAADAQTRIYVDNQDGDDQNSGATNNPQSSNGPVETIARALQIAAGTSTAEIISIEASPTAYTVGFSTIDPSLSVSGFEATPDEGNAPEVILDLPNGGLEFNTATGTSASTQGSFSFLDGGADFLLLGDGNDDLEFTRGNIALGTGLVTIEGIDEVYVEYASVTGLPNYDDVPNEFYFTNVYPGGSVQPSGVILPRIIDADASTGEIDIYVDLNATTSVRTLDIGGAITFGDDGEEVRLYVEQLNAIDGTLNVRDGGGTTPATEFTASVQFLDGGNFGDVTVDAGATLLFGEDSSVDSFSQAAGDVYAANLGDELTVLGDFTRVVGFFDPDFVLVFDGDSDASFASGSGLDLQGLRIDGDQTVTLTDGAEIDIFGNSPLAIAPASGDLYIAEDATLAANGATISFESSGFSQVDGTIENGLVIFETFGGILGGEGTYDDIRIDGDTNISPIAEAEFTGSLFLIDGSLVAQNGTVTIDPDGPGPLPPTTSDITGDLSPVGDDALVFVDITNPTTGIVEFDVDPTAAEDFEGFNGENNPYDLTFADDEAGVFNSRTVTNGFDFNNVRNLLVDVNNGELNIFEDTFAEDTTPTIQGTFTVLDGGSAANSAEVNIRGGTLIVSGATTVENDATVELLGSAGSGQGNLRVNGPDNVVEGTITGAGDLQLADGTTVTGSARTSGRESRILSDILLFGNDADATLTGFASLGTASSEIDEGGTTSANTGGSLTVSLLADGTASVPESAGNIDAEINLDQSMLILASDVHVTTTSDIELGSLDTGDDANTFFVEGAPEITFGGDVMGLGPVWLATGSNRDFDGDGDIDLFDCDLDGDGDVDAADAALAATAFNSPGLGDTAGSPSGGPDGFADSDLNRDGDIDSDDQDIYDLVASVAAPTNIVNADDINAISAAAPNGGVITGASDLDNDGDVDAVDQAIYDLADVDGSNDVDGADEARVAAADDAGTAGLQLRSNFGTYTPGVPATYPANSQDTTPADGFVDSDIDRDGDVDNDDLILLTNYDRDNDGDIDADDTAIFDAADPDNDGQLGSGGTLLGDVDGDGDVDADDQRIVDAADVDQDGQVGANDLLVFASADENQDGTIDALGGADADGDGDFDATDRAILTRALAGGTDSIEVDGDDVSSVTIPTFHVGDDITDEVILDVDVLTNNLLVLEGVFNAASNDVLSGSNQNDNALTLAEGATLRLDDGYSVVENTGEEIIFAGQFDVIDNEQGPVTPYTALTVLASGQVGEFLVNGTSALPEVSGALAQQDFEVVDLTVSSGAQWDLNGHMFSLSGDLTLNGDDDVINSQTTVSRTSATDPFSEIAFVGADTSMVNVNAGTTLLGDGVDIRIAKDAGAIVMLDGGALLFDDEFNVPTGQNSTDTANDETLFLESGLFMAGTPENQQTVFVRLDHENAPLTTEDVDNGQGFVLVGAETEDPSVALVDTYISGNVQKRIANTGSLTPGRVIFPTGEDVDQDDDDRDYAPFTFDFESNGAGADFGLRTLNVTFVPENPGFNDSLPIDEEGIEGTPDFYWLISSSGGAFGQGTTFNVEARADDFVIVNSTDDLELIRRQAGDVDANDYTSVGGDASTFRIDLDGNDEGDPADDVVVVLETGVQSFLGSQATIVTFGLTSGQRPVANESGTEVPTEFALNGNQPNPFSARTAISFDLPEAAEVSLEVYDVMGRRVVSIHKGAMTAGADQRVELDGSGLASGVYVFRLNAVGASETWTRSGQITLAR